VFSTFGSEEVLRDIYRISAPYTKGETVRTVADLREVFHRFLRDQQPYMPVATADDLFVVDDEIEAALVRAYSFDGVLDDLGQTEIIGPSFASADKRQRIDFARSALAVLLEADEKFAMVFTLAIHSLVVRPSTQQRGRASYGGSSSAAIGTIWLSLDRAVSTLDVMEMFVHELTHHLLFIDERSYPYFDYGQLISPANHAYSAILNLERPVDKVFHSIVVAAELTAARRSFLDGLDGPTTVHPRSDRLLAETQKSIASLLDLRNLDRLLMPRAREILDRCERILAPQGVL
jgi:hypothetical protein